MSLTRLLKGPLRQIAREVLDDFVPLDYKSPRPVPELRVPRLCKRPDLVGVAFDYAARIELQHLAPHAVAGRWIADRALTRLASNRVASERARRVVVAARQATHCGLPAARDARYRVIASHASKLAQLDAVFRAKKEPTFGARDGIDEHAIAGEVEQMMSVAAPLWALASEHPLILNPHFGALSRSVGGADADLIGGSELIELKVYGRCDVSRDDLRILAAYALMSIASDVALIETVAIYQARFGLLHTLNLRNGLDARECTQAVARLADLWQRTRSDKGPLS